MTKKLLILGDICFGRDISDIEGPFLSDDVAEFLADHIVIANLENPLVNVEDQQLDHLQFQGRVDKLKHFEFVDIWGLANNHINDLGPGGIKATVDILASNQVRNSGLLPSDAHVELENYVIFFVADMMNYKIDKQSEFDLLYLFDTETEEYIVKNRNVTKFNILYVHTGLLFCGEPSEKIRERLHYLSKLGLDIILTCHSHTLGPVEKFGDTLIHYSLGDFFMDGKSFRRRRSKGVVFEVRDGNLFCDQIDFVNDNYEVKFRSPSYLSYAKLSPFFLKLPKRLYYLLFNLIYKINLAHHICSTTLFLFKTKKNGDVFKLIWQRKSEVLRFFQWMKKDQNKMSDNYDAIARDRKTHRRGDL
jgi:hypothetical protein